MGQVESEYRSFALGRGRPIPPAPRSTIGLFRGGWDAAGNGPPLTPVSSHGAEAVAANLLEWNRRRPDYRGVPGVAFTLPPIAAVGLGEAAGRARGLRFRVKSEKTSGWYTARRLFSGTQAMLRSTGQRRLSSPDPAADHRRR